MMNKKKNITKTKRESRFVILFIDDIEKLR